MNKLPTDREVLKCVYAMYESSYPDVSAGEERGANDPYLQIDISAVAKRLKCKPELLFGLFYYHLDEKHHYRHDSGTRVSLFLLNVENKHHVVNFPYLAAILANHNLDHRRQLWSVGLSLLALAVSAGALIAQIATVK